MMENPYEAPAEKVVGVRSRKAADLMAIARYQKWIIWCIVLQAVLFAAPPTIGLQQISSISPDVLATIQAAVSLAVLLVLAVGGTAVILLSMKVFHPIWGVVLGLFACIPCVGLLVLLLVNGRATDILRRNGATVGLLGVRDMRPIHEAIARQRVE